jgi:hypothetical protein
MTIVDAPPENRSDRVVKVRQNFESAISRFGLRGAEADAWLVKSMAAIRDRVLEIEASRGIAQGGLIQAAIQGLSASKAFAPRPH